jgi:hypothetical protein
LPPTPAKETILGASGAIPSTTNAALPAKLAALLVAGSVSVAELLAISLSEKEPRFKAVVEL